jgi:hypothetical protein
MLDSRLLPNRIDAQPYLVTDSLSSDLHHWPAPIRVEDERRC